ncbi:hypothetical protein VTI74DRAFT_4250 [Chaetomium olivicolor]
MWRLSTCRAMRTCQTYPIGCCSGGDPDTCASTAGSAWDGMSGRGRHGTYWNLGKKVLCGGRRVTDEHSQVIELEICEPASVSRLPTFRKTYQGLKATRKLPLLDGSETLPRRWPFLVDVSGVRSHLREDQLNCLRVNVVRRPSLLLLYVLSLGVLLAL